MKTRQIWVAAALVVAVGIPVASMAQISPSGRGQSGRNDSRYDSRHQSDLERVVVHAERQSNYFRNLVERHWNNDHNRRWGRDWDHDWNRGRGGYDRPGQGRDDHHDDGHHHGTAYGQGYGYGRDDRYGRDSDRDYRHSRRLDPKAAVQRLDQALERLRAVVTRNRGKGYDKNDRYKPYHNNSVGRNEMMEVIRAADNVDFYFGRRRNYHPTLEREWDHVKHDLEPVARHYGVRMFGHW
jgi:hypothetical protein